MYWPKSVPVKEAKGVRHKKRDRHTERAHDCQKRHANYGPSLPVSIPTLGESLARKFTWRKLRKLRSLVGIEAGVIRRLERSLGGHKYKVGPEETGAHFFYMRHSHFVRLAPPAPFEGGAQILLDIPVHVLRKPPKKIKTALLKCKRCSDQKVFGKKYQASSNYVGRSRSNLNFEVIWEGKRAKSLKIKNLIR